MVLASGRTSAPPQAFFSLWTISPEGGLPESLPIPRAFKGTFSPDAQRTAYEEFSTAFIPGWYETSLWRHYRGGRTHPIRIITLADYSVEKLPWSNSNDTDPMCIGTRTWGALVGTLGVPPTIDGGGITAPTLAFYDLSGKWAVENEGVAPDIEVEYVPAEVNKGHDPQLERAVQEAMRLLEQNPVRRVTRPEPIDRVSRQQR